MLYLITVSVLWGFSFVIIKGTLSTLDSNFVSFVRLALSFVLFLPLVRRAGITLSDKLRLILIGGVQFGLMYVAYVASYKYLPAHIIALMTTTTPLFVVIFDDLAGKKFHLMSFIAALLAVGGAGVIEFPDQPSMLNAYGILLVQLSNAAFAFGQIAYRRLMQSRAGLNDSGIFGFMYGGAVVVAGVFSLLATDFSRLTVYPDQWLALLYLGVVSSGLGFFLWNLGARRVNGGALAVMNNLKIPIAVSASLWILRESTNYPRLICGCILFAAALWVGERRTRSAQQSMSS